MMTKCFQVTLESFGWGDNQKERIDALASVPPLEFLAHSSRGSLSRLLAAREDQSFIEPIKAGKSTALYKYNCKHLTTKSESMIEGVLGSDCRWFLIFFWFY
ncbi:protein FAM98A-like [Platichthys flesus]|uniref:protein FAM98A-like n=1 Tax=Platichthys flesus TaxID=8260 RepID=UPI002DB8D9CA|nr:protein FAM98A-like [Platichthys flesus]